MKTIIIGEAGVNHNGDLELAKRLVDVGVAAGVDYVKFQIGIAELVTSKFASKAEYQKTTTGSDESQLDMLRKIGLTFDEQRQLKEYCHFVGAQYLCTPFDLPSIDFLQSLDMPLWKVPSGEITNFPYLRKIGESGKPVILSTGMANIEEIETAIDVLVKYGTPRKAITLLHCTTEYPAPKNEVNLRAMATMRTHFDLPVGYSDHTTGIEIPIAAVAMGAVVIEKHFTLDRTMKGPDHSASLEPDELAQMVASIRNVELALGNGVKAVSDSERKNIAIARKSIIAQVDIRKGDILDESNLITKRPGSGISAMEWENVLGRVAVRDFKADELIEL